MTYSKMMRCELCEVSVSGERNFQMHLKGKKHRMRLEQVPEIGDDRSEDDDSSPTPFRRNTINYEVPDIAPGEPIPPGLEDVVENISHVQPDGDNDLKETPVVADPKSHFAESLSSDSEGDWAPACQMQSEMDAHKPTLIGLDFLVEATVKDAPEKVEYFCLLCDKKGPKRIAISHIMTLKHQASYLQKLFPALKKRMTAQFRDESAKKIIPALIHEVCNKIEAMVGRPKPSVVEKDKLVPRKSQYYDEIFKKHRLRIKGISIQVLFDLIDTKGKMMVSEIEKSGGLRKERSTEEKNLKDCGKGRKADEDYDEIEVLSVVSKVKVLVDISKEEEEGSYEVKESLRGGPGADRKASASFRSETAKSGGKHPAVDNSSDRLRRSLSNLSSISSISSPEHSLVRVSSGDSSPHAAMERRFLRRYSPARPRRTVYSHPARRSPYFRGRVMERIPRRPRSRSRSRSRSKSRSRSRPLSGLRTSRSSSGSRPRSVTRSRPQLKRKRRNISPLRSSISPARSLKRHGSPRGSSKYREKHRVKGLPSKSDAERKNRSSHVEDRSGKSSSRSKPESQFNTWEKFRIEADELEVEMAATRQRYERSPEKHPRYAAEWKIFYSRRMEEAKGQKTLDPRSEEFKLEWIAFWGEKMNELLNEEFRKRKDAIRKRLGLPEEPQPLPRFQMKKRTDKRPSNSEGEDDWIPPPPRKLTEKPSQAHPATSERKPVTVSDVKSTWRALTGASISSGAKKTREEFEVIWGNSNGGLISTLRVISALEEQLGSLGPRVNSHLSRALVVQRGGGSLIPLIHSSDIIVLLETVKEKLLGQLQAGIVRRSMVAAVDGAVLAISNLLEKVNEYEIPIKSDDVNYVQSVSSYAFAASHEVLPQLREAIESVTGRLIPGSSQNKAKVSKPEAVVGAPLTVPGIGEVNKVAIAQQIALVLIQGGRTDVTESELQKLVDEVVGLAEAQASENDVPKERCEVSQEGMDTDNLENPMSNNGSSSNELKTEICDHAIGHEQASGEQSSPKYSLIEVDLEEDPCKRSYRDLSVQALLLAVEKERRDGESNGNELKKTLQRFLYLSPEEQVCLITYVEKHKLELPEEYEMLSRVLARRKLIEEEQEDKSSFLPAVEALTMSGENYSTPAEEGSLVGAEMRGDLSERLDRSELEMRRELADQGKLLTPMNRSNVNMPPETNCDRAVTLGRAATASLSDQYGGLSEERFSHDDVSTAASAPSVYKYLRIEDPRHRLLASNNSEYPQPRGIQYDERDYASLHSSGHSQISGTNFRDYYPGQIDSEHYNLQSNRTTDYLVRQQHFRGNPDVDEFGENNQSYYRQQQSLNIDSRNFEGRDSRNYPNYPSGDYYDY